MVEDTHAVQSYPIGSPNTHTHPSLAGMYTKPSPPIRQSFAQRPFTLIFNYRRSQLGGSPPQRTRVNFHGFLFISGEPFGSRRKPTGDLPRIVFRTTVPLHSRCFHRTRGYIVFV